jgi:peptidoglycan/xylan/chitin deacetylase (PgdA/CDA1 family)/glycosyltransferase involved in cell wall biosynthesis/SAM-dependent methyltransferase
MNAGRIAAILTCHNYGRWLAQALESVERQTRPAAEIVVVDDASSDVYTRQVLGRLRLDGTLIAQSGGAGVAVARNCGAKITSADYLVWLDADDWFEPDYFEAAAAALDGSSDLDFATSALRGFGDAHYVWTPPSPTFVEAISVGGWPHASTMMRRRLWESVGGFDESLRSFELLDFWASAMGRGSRGVVLEKAFLNYRVHRGSGYQRMLQPNTYAEGMARFYAKHHEAVACHGRDLLLGKEAFLLAQRDACRALEARTASLEAELTRLRLEIADATRALEARAMSRVEWGDLGQTEPVSRNWGCDRGQPIDRYYIEHFLERHRSDVQGRVLEVKESMYTHRFGSGTVGSSDVVDIDPLNAEATITADLRRAHGIEANTFDCIILTQTLHLIDDMPAVLAECARILRPGGVLLLTAPSVSRIDPVSGVDRDFWRLTEASARRLLAALFPLESFEVTTYGNVKTCTAFLQGLAVEEMAIADLERRDEAFPLVVAARAVKPTIVRGETVAFDTRRLSHTAAAVLAYHRIAKLRPDSHGLCLPPDEFRMQMAYLHDHFTPIGLDELVQAAAAGRIPERAVALTFDDGYLDALTVASPILVECGMPATFFVNTERFSDEHERWWDVLEFIFLGQATLPPVLALRVGGHDLKASTTTHEERKAALAALHRAAWTLDAAGRASLAGHVIEWSGITCPARSTHRVMTGDEIQLLANRPGHVIGAHTTHHLALTAHPSAMKQREVLENKETLERLLRRRVDLFAYPYGELDADTLAVVRDAGFRGAVTVQPGMVVAGTNRLLLPRHEINPRDGATFSAQMRRLFEG